MSHTIERYESVIFQYQNGLNNGDVINGCGFFLIINFCNFVLRLLLPNDTRQVLQRQNYKVGQNNYKVRQLKNYKVGQKDLKVGQVLQSGA